MVGQVSSPHHSQSRQPQTSSPNQPQLQDQALLNRQLAPLNLEMENGNLSAIAPLEEGHLNTSIDSVFILSPSSVPSDPRQPVNFDKVMFKEEKPVRLALHSDGGVAVCRICHSSEKSCPFSNGEPLISPCHCRGSTGLYHRTCLERWLSMSNKDKCEICKFQYQVERDPKKLSEFVLKPGSKSIRRHMISDFVCWLILTPTAAVGSWLCISGAVNRPSPVDPGDHLERGVQVPTLVGLAAFLIVTYLVWSVICMRYHIRTFRRWQQKNYRIRIVLATDPKRKSRKGSAPIAHGNSNVDSQPQVPRTPLRPSGPTVAPRSHSIGSVGTHYSTPWPAVPRITPASVGDTPYSCRSSNRGLSTIFEPRAMHIPMEDVIL